MNAKQPAPHELAVCVLLQTHFPGLPFSADLFGIWPHLSLFSSSASLDFFFNHFLGFGVACLPGAQIGFTFDRHIPEPDFLSPVASTGTQCTCQANYGSFVIKTLWWC